MPRFGLRVAPAPVVFPALSVLSVLALLLAGCASPASEGSPPTDAPGVIPGRTGHALEGQPAPDYRTTDLDGAPVALADHAGRPVVLHVWTSWCSVCEAEEPVRHELFAEYGDRVDFVSVSVDDPRYEDAMRAEAAEADGEQWWDPDDAVRPLFQVSYQPVTIFIAADGTVDAVWQGQRGDRTTLRAGESLARVVLDRIAGDADATDAATAA